MKITFLQQGRTFTIGEYTVYPTFSAPIGPNIKQLVRFTEVGTDTSLSVFVMTDVNGTTESGHTVSLKNVYDGMLFDLSSLAPLMGKDVVSRTINDPSGAGVSLTVTVRFTTPTGKALSVYVYPCGSVRLGNTGAANAFSEYNYAPAGRSLILEGSTIYKVPNQSVGGFTGVTGFGGSVTPNTFIGDLYAGPSTAKLQTRILGGTISMLVRNTESSGYLRFALVNNGSVYADVQARETKLIVLPYSAEAGTRVGFSVYGYGRNYQTFIPANLMVNTGSCPQRFSLGRVELADTAEQFRQYIGALTDYQDGYFNLLGQTAAGGNGGDYIYAGGAHQMTAVGPPFYNAVYFPPRQGLTMNVYAMQESGEPASLLLGGYKSGYRISNNVRWAEDAKTYIMADGTGTNRQYGFERYRKKAHYELPLEQKVALRWLNSRGAWDSMFFASYKLSPQINATGTVDSYDFNVSVVIDWDNEEALYYLTRSPYIMALTPADVGQWGWATSESNGVFALQGGNIGKTLNLKFNYKINQA